MNTELLKIGTKQSGRGTTDSLRNSSPDAAVSFFIFHLNEEGYSFCNVGD